MGSFNFYKSCVKHYGTLEELGIPVVKPFLCFGSGPFWFHKVDLQEFDKQQLKAVGVKTWGRYEGSSPVVVTVDPDLIKEIFVKKFDNFPERLEFKVKEKYMTMDILVGEEWKYVRKSLSPVFTTGKLKTMIDPIQDVQEKMIAHLNHQSSKAGWSLSGINITTDYIFTFADNQAFEIEAKTVFQVTTFQVIMKVAFGIDANLIHDDKLLTDEPFYKQAVESLGSITSTNYLNDVVWLLLYMKPQLSSMIMNLFSASFDSMLLSA